MADVKNPTPKEVEDYAKKSVTRGLEAKYQSMIRQREGLEVELVKAEASGDEKEKARVMKLLAENLKNRRIYGRALMARGVPLKDPHVGSARAELRESQG